MSTDYQIRDQSALHYLTIQGVDWIDDWHASETERQRATEHKRQSR